MSASGGSSSSKPKDVTPTAFKALQVPFANVIASMLGVSPTPGANYNPYTGTTPQGTAGASPGAGTGTVAAGGNGVPGAVKTPGQQYFVGNTTFGQDSTGLGMVPANTGTRGGTSAGAGGAGTVGPYPQPSYTNPNDVLAGIPTYGGQTTAPLTGNETSLLGQLMQGSGNSGYLQQLLSGTFLNQSPQVSAGNVNPNQLPTVTPQQVAQNTGAINYGTGATADPYANMQLGNVNNPLLQAYITAAQRPTLENLTETLTRDLPSRFTAAGQFVQPTGSSAFDRAAAIASRGAANAIGDIGTNIGYQGYNLDRTLQEQAINEQQNRLLSAATGTAGNALSAAQGNQTTALGAGQSNLSAILSALQGNQSAGLEAQKANQGAYETERQLQQGGVQLNQQEVQNTIQNLQAQALPRLIQQYGLDQGLQQFNNQVNNLMTLLQTAGGVTHPVIGNQSSSSQFGFGLPGK